MKAILDNPYRILGLLVGASAREQDRQINRLKQYIAAEDTPPPDFSFPVLGTLNRTLETVEGAASKLHLDRDKMNAALFWFYEGDSVSDKPALKALKVSSMLYAATIWSNQIVREETITENNCSAYHNYSTLLLWQSLRNKSINQTFLEEGIRMKLQFLDSDFMEELKLKATDETFKITKKTVQLAFLNSLQQELEQTGEITSIQWIEILSQLNFSAKEEYLNSFIQKPIGEIEKEIETAQTKRNANKANTANAGNELYRSVENELRQLQSVLGIDHIRYSSIADKVANEILQCGIDFFNQYKDSSTDPCNTSIWLIQRAKSIAVNTVCKQRCDENIDELQKWINNAHVRGKERQIAVPLTFITDKLQLFKSQSNSIDNARKLIVLCKPKLDEIKIVLGAHDDYYLQLSSAVVNSAQNMLVAIVNKVYDERHMDIYLSSLHPKVTSLSELKSIVNKAYNVMISMQTMDMLPELRVQFNNNKSTLLEVKKTIGGTGYGAGYEIAQRIKEVCYKVSKWLTKLFATY